MISWSIIGVSMQYVCIHSTVGKFQFTDDYLMINFSTKPLADWAITLIKLIPFIYDLL